MTTTSVVRPSTSSRIRSLAAPAAARLHTGTRNAWRQIPRALALAALLVTGGCGDLEPEAEGPPDGIDSIQRELSSIDCTETTATGYVSGSAFSITVVTVDGKKMETKSANAYYVMAQAAAKAGVNLKVVSGFRTMAEQTYLYNCYINCNCNSCNLAAKPGYSNHQSGHAVDLNTSSSGIYSWLSSHAGTYGFKRTVPSESWHWEWWGGGPGGGPCGKPTFPRLTIKLAMDDLAGQARDLCKAGASAGIFDWWEGQQGTLSVDVRNGGSAVAKNVEVGVSAAEPYVEIASWKIYSDHNQPSGSFKLNDTDAKQSIGHESPGKSFSLWLGSISVGETKRIKLKVDAKSFSLTASAHPELRGHVAKIEGYYKKSGYIAAPSLNLKSYQTQNGGDLRAAFKSDVLAQERCDGQDNDCDGQIDEDGCGGDAATGGDAGTEAGGEADAQVGPGTDAGVTLDTASAGDGAIGSEETGTGDDGCSVAGVAGGGAGARPLPSLPLLGLLLLARRRPPPVA